jgi:23S rRNA pseudouridine1911/1915/1917 synthase
MDTSGILLVARTDQEYLGLIEQFANRTIAKKYLALVEGDFPHESGVISAPVARKPSDRRKMQIDWSGKEAVTRFRMIARSGRTTFLELDLITGRTHQVRVHLAAVGHPVVGDTAYGKPVPPALNREGSRLTPRQMLHAWQISAGRPDGSRITCRAAVPNDILRAAGERGIDESALSDYAHTGWNSDE